MSAPIKEFAPTTIIAVVVAWCCWSYLDEPRGGARAKQDDKPPKTVDSPLSAVIEPVCERDPFQPVDATKMASEKPEGQTSFSSRSDALSASSRQENESFFSAIESALFQKPGLLLRPILGEFMSSMDGEAPLASCGGPADTTDTLQSLVLEGTYIHGDHRIALINGRVYQQGKRLAISDSTTEPCSVKEISAHKVLILHRGQTVELTYRNPVLEAEQGQEPTP